MKSNRIKQRNHKIIKDIMSFFEKQMIKHTYKKPRHIKRYGLQYATDNMH